MQRQSVTIALLLGVAACLLCFTQAVPIQDLARRQYLTKATSASPALAEVLATTSTSTQTETAVDLMDKEMAVLKRRCHAHRLRLNMRFKRADGSSSSSTDDCDCEACAAEESSEESTDGCKCNCTDPCKAFDEAFQQRQLMKPALTTLSVVAHVTPRPMDPELSEAIQRSNDEEDMCKINKAEGKPCVRSFLEEVECFRFKECWLEECYRLKTLCKKEMTSPELVDEFSVRETFQPEIGKFKAPDLPCCTALENPSCKPCRRAAVDEFPSDRHYNK